MTISPRVDQVHLMHEGAATPVVARKGSPSKQTSRACECLRRGR